MRQTVTAIALLLLVSSQALAQTRPEDAQREIQEQLKLTEQLKKRVNDISTEPRASSAVPQQAAPVYQTVQLAPQVSYLQQPSVAMPQVQYMQYGGRMEGQHHVQGHPLLRAFGWVGLMPLRAFGPMYFGPNLYNKGLRVGRYRE